MKHPVWRAQAIALFLFTSALLVTLAPLAHADSQVTILKATTAGSSVDLVLDASGIPAGADLSQGKVAVTVDGQPVAVTVQLGDQVTTTSAEPSRTALLVVDTSGSMAGTPLTQVKAAALAFLAKVPPDVAVGLVAFSDTPHELVAPTRDRAQVQARLVSLQAGGGTALYDAMRLGLSAVGASGDRLLVVLSDGADTASRSSLEAATLALRSSGVHAAFVGYQTDANQTRTLSGLAAAAGGRLTPASDAGSLVSAFSVAAATFASTIQVHGSLDQPLATGTHFVAVTLAVEGGTVGTSTNLVVDPPPPAPTTAPSTPAGSSHRTAAPALVGLLVLVFLALLLAFLTALTPGRRMTASLRALEGYRLGVAGRTPARAVGADEPAGIARTALNLSDRFVEKRGLADRIALRLERADVRLRPNEWVLLRACTGLAVVAVLTLVTGSLLIGLPAGFALTWLGSHLVLSHRIRKRHEAFEAQLPDTLHLVASSIRTGFSLGQALDGAAQSATQPMGAELNRALAETRLGDGVENALDRVADRVDSRDLHWTVMAIRIQQHTGGNLSEVLQTTAATIRERASMGRRVRALSAEGRLSAYILIALPILLFAFLFLTRRPYVSQLWTTTPGLVMSAVGIVLTVVGWVWMRKLSVVEI